MENENDISLPKSVEVDEIIEFYKDKEFNEPEDTPKAQPKKINAVTGFLNRFKKHDADTDIQAQTFGLTHNGRMILYRIISAVVAVMIISVSFVLAYFLPGNEEVIAEQQAELRKEDDYVSLKSRHDALETEVENIKSENKTKKKQIDEILDIDNTKAELRTEITKKKNELSELNKEISEKRDTIAALDQIIAQKSAQEITLPPGKYVAGKNIAAGKYKVTGSGKFMLSTGAGKSKINVVLTSTPLDITVDSGDILKFDGKVKFTSQN